MTEDAILQETAIIIQDAENVIRDRKNWTQQTLAKDRNGQACVVTDPNAERWCALGAVNLVTASHGIFPHESGDRAVRALEAEARHMGFDSIMALNDDWAKEWEEAHKQVMAMYAGARRRIESAMPTRQMEENQAGQLL